MPDERIPLDTEGWVRHVNDILRRHSDFRPDMRIVVSPLITECTAFATKDTMITGADMMVFEQALVEAHRTHRHQR